MTSTNASASCSSGRGPEHGSGVFPTFAGSLVFLVLLLLAVQVVLGLYATSVVSAVAYDAAKTVAGADAGGRVEAQAQREADAAARASLGRMGRRVDLAWSREDDDVVLRVRAPRPVVLPRSLLGGWADIERTVRVRIEAVR